MIVIFPEFPQTQLPGVEAKINYSYAETLLFVSPYIQTPSRSKVQEDKRKWNLSPAGKRPSVIRGAGFYLGFLFLRGKSILKIFFVPRSSEESF